MQSPQNQSTNTEPTALTFVVEAMSCAHCKVAVADHVSGVAGVDAVEVDLDTKLVRVRGADINADHVIRAIDDAGYDAVAA
jgi:copper chaperone